MRFVTLITLLLAVALMPNVGFAQAKMQLYPTRINLTENQKFAEVNVINAGSATGRYRIELADMLMPEEGALQKQDDIELEYSLIPYLRVTPRSVEVPPAQSQKFRMLMRVPRDMADGEYRTHAHVLMTSTDVKGELEAREGDGFGIKMQPRFRVSIPIVYMKGETWFKANITSAELLRPEKEGLKPTVRTHFTTEGNRSTWGNLIVNLRRGESITELYRLNGYTIYRGTNSKHHTMPLDLPEGVSLAGGGQLEITYSHTEDDGGAVIASHILPL